MVFGEGDERFPSLAEAEAMLLVHVIGMELNLGPLPDDVMQVSGFGGEDAGVLWSWMQCPKMIL
jgi:hypothetical protein